MHIVFETVNFVYEDSLCQKYNLLPVDKLILIYLAKRSGPKGICPSTNKIAKALEFTPTYIKERINLLEQKRVISITKKFGAVNQYKLLFLSTDQSTTVDQSTVVDQSTTVSEPVNPSLVNRSTPVDTISSLSTNITRERRKNRAHPLPDDYLHTDVHEEKGQAMNMTPDEFYDCLDKFKAHHKAKGTEKVDWDAELDLWLLREERYRAEETVKRALRASDRSSGNGSGRGQPEQRSTVPWFNGHDPIAVGSIIDKGFLNGHGRKG